MVVRRSNGCGGGDCDVWVPLGHLPRDGRTIIRSMTHNIPLHLTHCSSARSFALHCPSCLLAPLCMFDRNMSISFSSFTLCIVMTVTLVLDEDRGD